MAIIIKQIIKDLFSGIKNIFSVFFNSLWKIIFKTAFFPIYKLILAVKKPINKHLIHNPNLNINLEKNFLKQRSIFHIIIAIIVVFVLMTNFVTRNTYAENFNKDSIIANIIVDDFNELIVEKPPSIEVVLNRPKTENIADQLSVLETTKNIITENKNDESKNENNKISLSQGGEALITPTVTPFEDQTETSNPAEITDNQVKTYTVQPGDTIGAIAEKFNISINTILWENNLSLNSYIRPGDKLSILPVSGITYTILSGDTLGKIANKFDSDINKIITFNHLDPNQPIRVRQKLIIPDGRLGATSLTPTRSISNKTLTSSSDSPSANNFLWPSNSKRITQYYHWGHQAIDIGAKAGSPIYAMKAGRVEYAGWGTGYGYHVIIDHGGGIKSLYAHSQKLYVKRGDQVKQGEIIGEIGSTGWSTGPHVHLEIIINGTKVNPLSYL